MAISVINFYCDFSSRKVVFLLTQYGGWHEDPVTRRSHEEIQDDKDVIVGHKGHTHSSRHLEHGGNYQSLLSTDPIKITYNNCTFQTLLQEMNFALFSQKFRGIIEG